MKHEEKFPNFAKILKNCQNVESKLVKILRKYFFDLKSNSEISLSFERERIFASWKIRRNVIESIFCNLKVCVSVFFFCHPHFWCYQISKSNIFENNRNLNNTQFYFKIIWIFGKFTDFWAFCCNCIKCFNIFDRYLRKFFPFLEVYIIST